jgi:hypothetical protein
MTRPPNAGLEWVEDLEIVYWVGEYEDREVVNDGIWVRRTRSWKLNISSSWLFVTAVWDVSQCLVVHFHFDLLTYDIIVCHEQGFFCNNLVSFTLNQLVVVSQWHPVESPSRLFYVKMNPQ